jgi:hypothetical protein
LVALKGSWNRSLPTGYKIVRVPFKDGWPEGDYEKFVTGFWASGEERAEAWGRPGGACGGEGRLAARRRRYRRHDLAHLLQGPPPAEHGAAPAEQTGPGTKTQAGR